jgi:hypothetical protein
MVNAQADKVPLGMFFPGDLSSPDMFAPDMIPVTPENKTPKTMKKSVFTVGSEQSREYL